MMTSAKSCARRLRGRRATSACRPVARRMGCGRSAAIPDRLLSNGTCPPRLLFAAPGRPEPRPTAPALVVVAAPGAAWAVSRPTADAAIVTKSWLLNRKLFGRMRDNALGCWLMAVTVYRFRCYDPNTSRLVVQDRWATEEVINRLPFGERVGNGVKVDDSFVQSDVPGMSAKGAHPRPPPGWPHWP